MCLITSSNTSLISRIAASSRTRGMRQADLGGACIRVTLSVHSAVHTGTSIEAEKSARCAVAWCHREVLSQGGGLQPQGCVAQPCGDSGAYCLAVKAQAGTPAFFKALGVLLCGVEARFVVLQIRQDQAGDIAVARAKQGFQAVAPALPVEQLAILAQQVDLKPGDHADKHDGAQGHGDGANPVATADGLVGIVGYRFMLVFLNGVPQPELVHLLVRSEEHTSELQS